MHLLVLTRGEYAPNPSTSGIGRKEGTGWQLDTLPGNWGSDNARVNMPRAMDATQFLVQPHGAPREPALGGPSLHVP